MKNKSIAVLFDLDGVIMDTETQYTRFWDKQGLKILGVENFSTSTKGVTLKNVFDNYFFEKIELQEQIRKELNDLERDMKYEYIAGFQDFILDLRKHNIKIAVVTSSNELKMENVYRSHPKFKDQFDKILTAGYFSRSKPDPECFLLGMKLFETSPEKSFVFEDSFHGLEAGMKSGATVVGLATTNSAEAITGKAHHIINDFTGMTYEKLMLLKN